MQSYPAYSDNGRIVPIGSPIIPNGRNLIITVLDDEPFFKEKNNNDDRVALWEEIKALHGIVRSDIDENEELAKARDDKYGRLS